MVCDGFNAGNISNANVPVAETRTAVSLSFQNIDDEKHMGTKDSDNYYLDVGDIVQKNKVNKNDSLIAKSSYMTLDNKSLNSRSAPLLTCDTLIADRQSIS
ncbi:hypothetical protein J6G99_07940 [bacterium]|nr:hypothetical protein [bacterium]